MLQKTRLGKQDKTESLVFASKSAGLFKRRKRTHLGDVSRKGLRKLYLEIITVLISLLDLKTYLLGVREAKGRALIG
jgi:hypothetical protein